MAIRAPRAGEAGVVQPVRRPPRVHAVRYWHTRGPKGSAWSFAIPSVIGLACCVRM
jgi:hypothetical protein